MSSVKTEWDFDPDEGKWTKTTTYNNSDGSKDIYEAQHEFSMIFGTIASGSSSHEHVDSDDE